MRCRDLQHSSEANKTTLNKVPAVFWVNLLKPQGLCVGKNDCTPPQFLRCSTRWSVAGLGRVYPATTALCDCISLTQSRTTRWKLFHRYFLALEVSFSAPLHLLLSIPEQCPPLLAALWCFWVLFHFGFPQLQHSLSLPCVRPRGVILRLLIEFQLDFQIVSNFQQNFELSPCPWT